MGSNNTLVRFPWILLSHARRDREVATRLALDGEREFGAVEIQIGRREYEIYALLRPEAPTNRAVHDIDDPLAHALVGSPQFLLKKWPPIDTGYGTPHVVGPAEVQVIAALLARLDDETVRARARDRDLDPEGSVGSVRSLRRFYVDAAAERQGVVITPI